MHWLVCYGISALWPWDQLALPQGELYWMAFHLLIKYLLSPCLGPEQTPECNHSLLYQPDLGAKRCFPLTSSMHLGNFTLVTSSEREGWKSYQLHKMLLGMKGECESGTLTQLSTVSGTSKCSIDSSHRYPRSLPCHTNVWPQDAVGEMNLEFLQSHTWLLPNWPAILGHKWEMLEGKGCSGLNPKDLFAALGRTRYQLRT